MPADQETRLTLILCDDHALFREGLSLLLGQQRGWQVLAEAANGAEAVRLAGELQPDIAILDVAMPTMSGIEAAHAIREISRGTRIVALSMYSDAHYRRLMSEAGAAAYVLKNEASAELVEAIHAVLRGEIYVSPLIERSLTPDPQDHAERDLNLLSERELAVLRLMVEGVRTKEIAEALGISAKTVETYRARMMQKLGVDSLAGLIKLAFRTGLTPLN
ncbi:response regulator transcription factor [Thiorhodococcus mannitoliphagus]|uniref:Response regulator transcription factor n=1 Tax=Thiorhodococcus mannitoliphagus TaxID=329406 RepID=A0A6P1DYG6_9GAMM|nr:response regulator transcription factor [Thiorhodococcus mannitoliphagus]NEX22051.1 response regulator transcription factor [Thiorhodococcus mannitoliphagus]